MSEPQFTKAELLQRMGAGRQQFEQALARVPADQMTDPNLANGWSVRDMLGHINFWEQRIARIFRALQNGTDIDDPVGDDDVDALNQRVYKANRSRSVDELRREEQAAYADIMALVEGAAHDDLFDGQRFAWTEGDPFYGWIVGNTFGHYAEHLPDMLRWLDDGGW